MTDDKSAELCLELAFAYGSEPPTNLDSYSAERATLKEIHHTYVECAGSKTSEFELGWLPFAAEKYRISPNLRDYVVVPVDIMPSDLPNRNLVAFPLARLSEFNPDLGMLSYRSWVGKPCFADHMNDDPSTAKGVVLDVGIRPLQSIEGGIFKVTALCAFDRTRDPYLTQSILDKRITSYSMGAMVNGYHCSICGSKAARPTEPKCSHIPAARNKFNVYPVDGRQVLAFWQTGPFTGFEVSALRPEVTGIGAFPSTDATEEILYST